MSKEGVPLQYDLFSGELVDARSDYQKKKDRERTTPQQTQMFKTPEIVQFGARTKSAYREWLDQAVAPALMLISQDVRTPEEIELDLLREAQKLTKPLFESEDLTLEEPATEDTDIPQPSLPRSGVIFDGQTPCYPIGLRKQLRRQSIPVRPRCRTT